MAPRATSSAPPTRGPRFLDAAQTPTLFMAGTLIPRTRIRVLLQRRTDISLPVRVLSSVPRTLLWREVADSREKICRAVDAEIAACRAGDPRYEGTILGMLADTKDEAGAGLTDEEINDEVLTLLMAGHETTATTLAWALHHLAANPAAQQRLFEELSGSFPEGVVDPDRARKLPYLSAVVNETLRLTPIAVAVPRRLREAVTLAGHHLPAGTTVGASIYVAHRSLAWERPDEFEPERFLTGSPSPFIFFPFGGGTRRCVGAEFARYQLAVVLGQLILSREFNPVPSFTMRPYMRGPRSPRRPACRCRSAPGRPPEMNLRITIEHGKCLGTGSCVMLAAEHFEPGADGKALVRCDGGAPSPEGTLTGLTQTQSDQVREAAMFCPPEAITVRDADTGEQYYP
jgi:cytochrome P450/ferredoxin